MAELEDKLGAVLNNPQLMQQIMSMAGSLSQNTPAPPRQESQPMAQPELDPALLTQLATLGSTSAVDNDQRALLNALCPYISRDRINRLERAMRAAKIASFASGFLNKSGLLQGLGR